MLAYLNGKFIPLENASIPVWDYGFTMGVSVTEHLRTYHGELRFLDYHLERLATGMAITDIDSGLTIEEIGALATDIAAKNFYELLPGNDLSVGIVVTAGAQAARAPASVSDLPASTILIYALPLAFQNWVAEYQTGIQLQTVQTREIPGECIPRDLKCRSRMHYYLAEKEASQKLAGSRALLLDIAGNVSEGTTASLLMVQGGNIIAPKRDHVLPSISVRFLETEICPRLAIQFSRRNFKPEELKTADELLWLSTSACALPVSQVDGCEISGSESKPVFFRIMAEWSAQVGCDIMEQAIAFGQP